MPLSRQVLLFAKPTSLVTKHSYVLGPKRLHPREATTQITQLESIVPPTKHPDLRSPLVSSPVPTACPQPVAVTVSRNSL